MNINIDIDDTIVNNIIEYFYNAYISEDDLDIYLKNGDYTEIESFKIKNAINKYDLKNFSKYLYNSTDITNLAYHEIVEKYGDFYITKNDIDSYLDTYYARCIGNFRDIVKHKVDYYNNVYFYGYDVDKYGNVEEKISNIETNEDIVNNRVEELIAIANGSYIFDSDINEYFRNCWHTTDSNLISYVKERMKEYNKAHINEINTTKLAKEIINIFGNKYIEEVDIDMHIRNIYGKLPSNVVDDVKQYIDEYDIKHFNKPLFDEHIDNITTTSYLDILKKCIDESTKNAWYDSYQAEINNCFTSKNKLDKKFDKKKIILNW